MKRAGFSMTLMVAVTGVIALIVTVIATGGFGNVFSGAEGFLGFMSDDSKSDYCESRIPDWCERHPGENWQQEYGERCEGVDYGAGGTTCCNAGYTWDASMGACVDDTGSPGGAPSTQCANNGGFCTTASECNRFGGTEASYSCAAASSDFCCVISGASPAP